MSCPMCEKRGIPGEAAFTEEERKHGVRIALAGNPNCGKTSLFNVASGAHEHVGNYSGVTVDAKQGHFDYKGYRFNICDLPGTYSLSAYTPEELYVRRHIVEKQPDVVVNVVVASNLERNLFLTTELIDMDLRMVVALNMYDELEASGDRFDYEMLGKMLGVPMVPTISRTGWGLDALFDTIIRVYEREDPVVRHIHVNHGTLLEESISQIKDAIKKEAREVYSLSPRYLAIKLLERDKEMEHILSNEPSYAHWIALRDKEGKRIEDTLGESVEAAVANEKYGFISGALHETLVPGKRNEFKTTRLIDSLVTHKIYGFPIFLFLMWVMFEATFVLGAYPMEWIESGVNALGGFIERFMSPGPLKDLLIDGVIGGVGSVIVFLPNILILYLFISFMEDSGYMARAAFIMDKIMHKVGLHGKSFIPLIMGFGCNVPAIMATRTVSSDRDRKMTILLTPYMSCSAKISIYAFFTAAFFPRYRALVMLGLYALGVLIGIVAALIMNKTVFRGKPVPFVMELPNYRMPGLKSVALLLWEKAKDFLQRAFTVIFLATIIIWFLQSFDTRLNVVADSAASLLALIGRWIAPIFRPLGFGDWRCATALISGFIAKESVVSTLQVLLGGAAISSLLSARAAVSFLVFTLLYTPCVAAVATIRRELGSRLKTVGVVVLQCTVAWIVACAAYAIAGLL